MTYFVAKRKHASEPFRVAYQEVKTRTSKGYPLTYELRTLPDEYASWEEALAVVESLNARLPGSGRSSGACPFTP